MASGFSAYLEGAPHYNFVMYRSLVHEVTQSFKTISEEAITISKTLCEKYKLNKVAECIDSIQAGEQEKLELVRL